MKVFNRLAHREFLILVAIAASAITLHVRQHVNDPAAQASQANSARMCEPRTANPNANADANEARAMPADCSIRANMGRTRSRAVWV